MKKILCATKDGRLWHITQDRVKTLCGKEEIDMLTEVETLEGQHLVCSQCLIQLKLIQLSHEEKDARENLHSQ